MPGRNFSCRWSPSVGSYWSGWPFLMYAAMLAAILAAMRSLSS